MAISLGGVSLHENLIWENYNSYPRNAFSRRVTIQGRVVIQHSAIDGREIILTTLATAGGTIGYFTKAQIDSIRDFENNMSVVSFTYESESINVIVQPGGINVDAIVPRPNHEVGDEFLGSIKLIERG